MGDAATTGGGREAGPTVEQLHEVLRKHWGYNAFRHRQLEIVQQVLHGRNVVALMATGMGKVRPALLQPTSTHSLSLFRSSSTHIMHPQSLCYQLPSVALRQTTNYKCVTVVISPLISLMGDQVAGLRSNGKYSTPRSAHSTPRRPCPDMPLYSFNAGIAAVALTGEASREDVEKAVRGVGAWNRMEWDA